MMIEISLTSLDYIQNKNIFRRKLSFHHDGEITIVKLCNHIIGLIYRRDNRLLYQHVQDNYGELVTIGEEIKIDQI